MVAYLMIFVMGASKVLHILDILFKSVPELIGCVSLHKLLPGGSTPTFLPGLAVPSSPHLRVEAPARLSGMVCHHCVPHPSPSVSRLPQNHDAAQPTPLATLVGVKTYQTTHVYAHTATELLFPQRISKQFYCLLEVSNGCYTPSWLRSRTHQPDPVVWSSFINEARP